MELLANYKDQIFEQNNDMTDFMYLLMKERNMKGKWTKEEVNRVRTQIKLLSVSMPFLVIFAFPVFMMPLLAKLLDRRKTIRSN
jgi:hypothetical protein